MSELKTNLNVVGALLELPPHVEFQGCVFEFKLFINHTYEIRFCYELSEVNKDSPHFAGFIDEDSLLYDQWTNEKGDYCDWLYLAENIYDNQTLLDGIIDCKKYLKSLGIIDNDNSVN